MKPFFSRNIDNPGRLVRGLGALVLLVGAGFGFTISVWLGLSLLAAGVFVGFDGEGDQREIAFLLRAPANVRQPCFELRVSGGAGHPGEDGQ